MGGDMIIGSAKENEDEPMTRFPRGWISPWNVLGHKCKW